MKVAILQVGKVEQSVLKHVQENVSKIFPQTEGVILEDVVPLPPEAYDAQRKQYHSSLLLPIIQEYLKSDADKILGITAADLYVPRLSFVFGEAERLGKAAIISLYRLVPELYGNSADETLFLERTFKEAVHEIGHTRGLTHCSNPSCVMSFSNTVNAVDTKKGKFCPKCSERLSEWIH